MGAQRKVLLALGGAILIAMMATAAYSIALDVTGNGWRQAPEQRPIQAEVLEQMQRLPRPAEIVGRIQHLTATSLTLSTPQGTRTVAMDPKTRVILLNGEPGGRNDLRRGMDIAIVGDFIDNGRALVARTAAVLPTHR